MTPGVPTPAALAMGRVGVNVQRILEFRGPLVHEWREYFDGRISAAMKAGAPMTDEIKSMLARPVK